MILKIWRENKIVVISFFISLAAAVTASIIFFAVGGDKLFLFIVKVAAIVIFIICFRAFVKVLKKYMTVFEKLKKTKIWRALGSVFGSLFDAFAKMGNAIKNKTYGILAKIFPHRGLRLRRYNDERTFVFGEKSRIGSRLRKMKWRNLSSNRERIRYIYIAFLKKQIKAGADINPADTPNELYAKLHEKNSGLENTLLSLYNVARYGVDDGRISEEDVEQVRRR